MLLSVRRSISLLHKTPPSSAKTDMGRVLPRAAPRAPSAADRQAFASVYEFSVREALGRSQLITAEAQDEPHARGEFCDAAWYGGTVWDPEKVAFFRWDVVRAMNDEALIGNFGRILFG